MSQYFQVDGHVLWNPSTGVSQVFVRAADSFAELVDHPSGISPIVADECEIQMETFALFISTLIGKYARSNHVILRSLMEGFLATAMALVERGGGELPSMQSCGDDPGIAALRELSHSLEKAMPQ